MVTIGISVKPLFTFMKQKRSNAIFPAKHSTLTDLYWVKKIYRYFFCRLAGHYCLMLQQYEEGALILCLSWPILQQLESSVCGVKCPHCNSPLHFHEVASTEHISLWPCSLELQLVWVQHVQQASARLNNSLVPVCKCWTQILLGVLTITLKNLLRVRLALSGSLFKRSALPLTHSKTGLEWYF